MFSELPGPKVATPVPIIGLLLAAFAAQLGAVEQTSVKSANAEVRQTELETSALTSVERRRLAQWALTETEWRRYRSLLEGISTGWTPKLLHPLHRPGCLRSRLLGLVSAPPYPE